MIFLSARGEVADKVSGLELGAIDYITKPIQGEEVLARVAAHLSRRHLERELRENRDRLDRELAGAAHMQRQLLPAAMPPHASISFGSYYQTSRHAGGDYYDVLPLGDDRFGILVADVSGHGAPAAIVMAMIRAVVHTYPGVADDPREVLHYINRHFQFLWDTSMYATAVYAVVDAGRATIRMASAGHPLPLKARCGEGVIPASLDTTMCLLWNELTDVPCAEFPLDARRSMGVLHRWHHRPAGAGRHDVRHGAPRCRHWPDTVQRLPPPSSTASSASSTRFPAAWSRKTIKRCWWWGSTDAEVLGS